jgi:predicted nuclease with RNAse H fold
MRQEALAKMNKILSHNFGTHEKTTARGMNLRKILESQKFRVIEVYPGGAQDVMGIPRKQAGLDKLRTGLESLGIEGLNNSMSDHELDSVTCAFVGKLFMEGKAVTFGTREQGIVMPAEEKPGINRN